jgi:hypothetical protein
MFLTIPAIPVCPRLPDGQGQAEMAGLSNGVNRKGSYEKI